MAEFPNFPASLRDSLEPSSATPNPKGLLLRAMEMSGSTAEFWRRRYGEDIHSIHAVFFVRYVNIVACVIFVLFFNTANVQPESVDRSWQILIQKGALKWQLYGSYGPWCWGCGSVCWWMTWDQCPERSWIRSLHTAGPSRVTRSIVRSSSGGNIGSRNKLIKNLHGNHGKSPIYKWTIFHGYVK